MVRLLEALGLALGAIWSAKLRSFLTVLGNIVAVTSIIAVVSIVQGMNSYVADAILNEVGADAFVIDRRGVTASEEDEERTRSNPLLTVEEAQAIRRFGGEVGVVMAEASRRARVSYRERELESVQVRGVTRDYAYFSGYEAAQGRLPSPLEVERRRPVALLGWGTAQRLFLGGSGVDQVVLIEGRHFRVVGVNEKKGSVFGNSQDEFAVIPLGAYQRLFGARQSLTLSVKPVSPDRIGPAMDEARIALRVQRRLGPRDEDNFGMFTSGTLLGLWATLTRGIFAVLIGVVALSLVVGGIVIMNIMLMVVSERTREIGLRKALGARRSDITSQILIESITLSVLGGVLGTMLGFVAAQVIGRVSPLPARVEPWSIAVGIAITAFVGLFFGWYPARRASRLDPIEALRRE